MVRILHDDWSIRLGENRSDQPIKHLEAMLCYYKSALSNEKAIPYTL